MGGDGFLLCDTQRNYQKSAKIDPIALRFGHEGLVKTKKLSYNNVKRARIKLSIPFENFKIAPQIEILLPELSKIMKSYFKK